MAYVVAEPCIKCKYTDCVEVCPVDCFHEGPVSLAIDPVVCIDCGACLTECPVDAIYGEDDLPPEYAEYVELNARFSAEWPVISVTQEPLPDAAVWAERNEKRRYLEPE